MSAGQKIIDGLKEAAAGNLSRVHIPDLNNTGHLQTWQRVDKDTVTIPLAEFEAYRAAAKALERYHHPPSRIDAQDCPCCNCEGERAIAALRAVGILEEE